MTDTLHLATRDIIRILSEEDDNGNTAYRYRGDLTTNSQLNITRGVTFWPFGNRRADYLSGSLEIHNPSGAYDDLLNIDIRDQKQVIRIVPADWKFTQSITLVTAVSDSLEIVDDETVRIKITDPLARFDKSANPRTESDGAELTAEKETITGKPSPVLIGVGRNIRPPLASEINDTSAADPIYRVSDGPLSQISVVRSRALALDTTVSPPQWEFALGGAGFELNVNPVGPITCDASTIGEAAIGVSPTDLMGGDGAFDSNFTEVSGSETSWVAITGTEWEYRTRNTGIIPEEDWKISSIEDNGRRWAQFRAGWVSGSNSVGWAEIRHQDTDSPAFTFEEGKTYRWRITRNNNLVGGVHSQGGIIDRAWMLLVAGPEATSNSSPQQAYPSNRILTAFSAYNDRSDAGTYSGTWTCPASADGQPLIIRIYGRCVTEFGDLEIFEIPDPTEDDLEGITLADFIEEVVIRAQEPVDEINFDSLDEIDDYSPRRLIGYWYESPPTAISLIRAPLDSYTADVFTSRSGQMSFVRLEDPANLTADYELGPYNIITEPRIEVDEAPGLTTTATARPNWFVFRDSDFVDNFDDVTLDMRQAFSENGQFTVRADIPADFPSQYKHAIDADSLDMLYDSESDAEAEIQRAVDFYGQLRFFVTVTVKLDFLPEVGDTVEFTYPRYGFDEGQNMRVISVQDRIRGDAAEIEHTLILHG